MSTVKIRRALISVSDKTGLIPLVQALKKHKVEILSTGGTLKALKAARLRAVAIEKFTGFPEILEGRVKTLHPKIHGGLLYRRDKEDHVKQAKKHRIEAIDLVIVNLYPFEEVTRAKSVTLETAIENIDIGGPSMLRSAAKNFDAVTVISDPDDYAVLLEELKGNGGATTAAFRRRMALKVFEKTSSYDRAIAGFLGRADLPELVEGMPARLDAVYEKVQDLRYGENPHQRAAFYQSREQKEHHRFEQLHGKELSFNNLLDIEAAMDVIREFSEPAACVVKHSNPCGIAEDRQLIKALGMAIECDAMSAFGGIIGINRPCTQEIAQAALDKLHFFEVLVAPSFDRQALALLKARKNLRLITVDLAGKPASYDIRFLKSGLLLQDPDPPVRLHENELIKNLHFVTQAKWNDSGTAHLLFAWKAVKVVKSNAIVITQGKQTVGIGAGQMSRVDSVEIACRKAGYRTQGGILASDAFFPMPDSIEVAHEHKIRAIIQPGGSLRDADVIAACDRLGIAMAFTGERHFRH